MEIGNQHTPEQILEYWTRTDVESMYDKHLLTAEIELIKHHLAANIKILDAGCGEGEGTLVYASTPGVVLHAADFSETRLKKAAERLGGLSNVVLKKVDFGGEYSLDADYDAIVSQRFLINLTDWGLQKKVLHDLMELLKPGGKLILLEGSQRGVDNLNEFRTAWGLDPIPVRWHNLFLDDDALCLFMEQSAYKLIDHDGLAAYFLLTRGIRPTLDRELHWDCEFNRIASGNRIRTLLGVDNTRCSRLKLWVFQK